MNESSRPLRLIATRRFAGDEAGSMSLMIAVIIVLLAGLFSLAIDAGSLYASKKRLQGAVDLAAVKAATDPANATAVAETVVLGNLGGLTLDGAITVERGDYPPPGYTFSTLHTLPTSERFSPNPAGLAVRIQADTDNQLYLARLFHPGPVPLQARSVAVNRPLAQLSARSGLVSVDTRQSEMLDSVLSGLLGTSFALSAVSYEGLAGAEVSLLDFLDAGADIVGVGEGDYEGVLDAAISMDEIASAAAAALSQAGSAEALAALDSVAGQLSGIPDIRLAEIIELDAERPEQAVGARLNLLGLLRAAAEAASGAHDLDAEVALPVVDGTATLRASIVEPTQYSALGGEGIAVSTAQVRLMLDFSLPDSAEVLGTVLDIRVPIYLELASGRAVITRIDCNGPGVADARVDVDATSSAAKIAVADVDPGTLGFSLPPVMRDAVVVGSPLARVTASALTEVGSGSRALSFGAPFTQGRFQVVAMQSPIEGVASGLFDDIDLEVEALGIPLATPAIVEGAVRSALLAAAPSIDTAVETVLDVIGMEVGRFEVAVNYLRCSNPLVVQ